MNISPPIMIHCFYRLKLRAEGFRGLSMPSRCRFYVLLVLRVAFYVIHETKHMALLSFNSLQRECPVSLKSSVLFLVSSYYGYRTPIGLAATWLHAAVAAVAAKPVAGSLGLERRLLNVLLQKQTNPA